jgi:hypothetical protein
MGGGSSLVLTTVTSSVSLCATDPVVVVTTGDNRWMVIPDAIVRSSISSATFW